MENVEYIVKKLEIYDSTLDRFGREPNIVNKSSSELNKIRACGQLVDSQLNKGKSKEEVANGMRVSMALSYLEKLRAKLQEAVTACEGDLGALKGVEGEIKGYKDKLMEAMVKGEDKNVMQYTKYADSVAQKLDSVINRKKHDSRLMKRNIDAIDAVTNKLFGEKKDENTDENGLTF